MARHGENIYKRKDGRYEGRYVTGKTLDGKTRFGYIYGRQYATVKKALLLKKAEFAKVPSANMSGDGETLGSWIAKWMEEELLGSVKPSSYQTYHALFRRHLLPLLGSLQLSSITPVTVLEFIDSLKTSGLSGSTVKGAYRLLSAAMKAAYDEGMIMKNPCRKIKIQSSERTEQRVLNREEQALLKNSISRARDLPALLSLYTGMRLGEICALRWSDIDWANQTIRVGRTVQRVARGKPGEKGERTMLMVGTPKSLRSCRVIPVPDFVLGQLQHWMLQRQSSLYVFGVSACAAEPRTIQRRFKRLVKSLGMPGVHFHTLRHSFATRLLELGVDVKTVSALLGHHSAQTTLDYYAHSQLEQRRAAVNHLVAVC